MRAFLSGLVLIVLIGVATWAVFDSFERSAAEAYSTSNVRL